MSCYGLDHLGSTQWQAGLISVSTEVEGCKGEISERVQESFYHSVALKVRGQVLNTVIAGAFCDATV